VRIPEICIVTAACFPGPFSDEDDGHLRLVIALIHHKRLGQQSPFSPYIAILPSTYPEHQKLWDSKPPADTQLGSRLQQELQRLETLLAQASLHLPNLTKQEFLWAHWSVLSRAALLAPERLAMVPFFDLFNHAPTSGSDYAFDEGTEEFVLSFPLATVESRDLSIVLVGDARVGKRNPSNPFNSVNQSTLPPRLSSPLFGRQNEPSLRAPVWRLRNRLYAYSL
jgi:hypothetical protein